jgi:NAD(P)-dependent dehydrogenase (short-subunit alcohol dehydrogenase family)
VIIAVKNLNKSETAVKKIKPKHPGADMEIMKLDLADLSSVKAFAGQFKNSHSRFDPMINNAEVMIPPYGKTKDGFELQMGTNYLRHFALTGLLLDLLKQTGQSRVVNVSSIAHKTGHIDFNGLHVENRGYKKWNAYGDSKIANLYFTYELEEKLAKKNSSIKSVAAHPAGLPKISIGIRSFPRQFPWGALLTLYAATGQDIESRDFSGPPGFMELRRYHRKVASNVLSRDGKQSKAL